MAHWVPTARWVRHPRLRRGAKVSPFICRASRRRSITSLTLIQWVPGWSLGRLPLQLFALHASCRRSVLRDRGQRGGALVKDEPVVVHCYTTPADIEDARNLAELGDFCRRMGRDARQGEVGLVVGNEYFAIRDFAEE